MFTKMLHSNLFPIIPYFQLIAEFKNFKKKSTIQVFLEWLTADKYLMLIPSNKLTFL